jgi:hypothetical protein
MVLTQVYISASFVILASFVIPGSFVIPAQAGIQNQHWRRIPWIPACAGMTTDAMDYSLR